MNRFRREFCKWADAKGLMVRYIPRKPEDWHVAKVASIMADRQARTPEFRARWLASVESAILNNEGVPARDSGIAYWLP
jgi:hypothetical protein